MYHNCSTNIFNINITSSLDNVILSFYLKFAEHIGYICMVFFFFMSAFWFYKGTESNKDTLKKWKKRIKTLLIPFLVWTVIIGGYQVVVWDMTFNLKDIFYHLFETPIAGPLWYILGLLILQLFAPIIIPLKQKKKIVTIIFSLIIIYISLRTLKIIPHFLEFKNWWWYNNLIFYTPVYILGAYIGMYYPDILLKLEYNAKKHTHIGLILLLTVLLFWHFITPNTNFLNIIYPIISIIGFWLILKPRFCSKNLPDFLNCGFFMFALHQPVLIPITNKFITLIIKNHSVIGTEVVLIKIIQLCAIIIISGVARKLASLIFSKNINYYLTGGR